MPFGLFARTCQSFVCILSIALAIDLCIAFPPQHHTGKQIDALMRILSPRPDWYAIREEGGLFHRPHVTGSDGFTQTEPLWDRSKGPNWDSGLEWTDRISLPLSVLDGDQSTVGFKPVEHFIPQKRDDLGW